jgi:transposase-like protein
MAMKTKKIQKPSRFILSKSANKELDDFVRNSKNPSLIFKESCGQLRLKVLKIHLGMGEWKWMEKQVRGWLKEKGITIEKGVEIAEDLLTKTIPRQDESRKWTYSLEAYLNQAARGFFNNYFQKRYRRERIEKNRIKLVEDDLTRVRKMFDKVLCLDSISKLQRQIILLFRDEREFTRVDMAKRLEISTKTIQRELKKIGENKDVQKIRDESFRIIPDKPDKKEQRANEEVMLYGSYLCRQCKKTFVSTHLVTLEKCKDHDGLKEV